jgi:virginiamycin A acetyltransferase
MIISNILHKLYSIENKTLRNIILKIVYRLEGGEYYPQTLRRIFKDYHGVEIGLYSHGGCFVPGLFDRFTSIGRYCSMAKSLRAMNRNHPLEYKSMHGFFFNPALKYCSEDKINFIPLKIGNDVWIGHNAIIMPNVKNIADGAVIAAGAVVNKDIPPYAVVVGNPSRVVRFRFSKEIIEELIASRWWEKSIEEIKPGIGEFTKNHA